NSEDVSVLSSGLRLPKIKTSHWVGDQGILLTFADGGVIKSAVEDALAVRGERWNDETMNYVWYLNFKTNQLNLVNRFGIAGNSVSYSDQKQGVYYVGYSDVLSEEEQEENAPLQFFSTTSSTSKVVAKNVASPNSLIYLRDCPEASNASVCIVETKEDKYVISSVDENKKTKLTDRSFDNITPTANPSIFIGTINHTTSNSNQEDEELAADLYHIDIENNKVSKLNTSISASRSILANTVTNDKFYIFEPSVGDDTNDMAYVSGAKNLLGFYRTKTQAAKTDSESKSILGPFSRTVNGESMFHDVEGNTYLITPSGQDYEPVTLTEQEMKSKLFNCFNTYTKGYLYTPELKQFKINIQYDNSFNKNIADFSKCSIEASPKTSVGYSFVFLGVSPSSGKFVTD
ncbi:MAG: hypothetical protein ABIR46_03935, partial [Candidatus Saccharimonadales bacterium]